MIEFNSRDEHKNINILYSFHRSSTVNIKLDFSTILDDIFGVLKIDI